jgi:hypothetical protein
VGGGGKIVLGREKKIGRKNNSITACFTCLQLSVTLLYICVCEYAYIRMTDHEHRTYEAIRTYIHKYVLVWVCARVATKNKKEHTNTYEHMCMYIYIATCVCECVCARAV